MHCFREVIWMQTREEKIFQRIGHCVMIVLSACAIIPMILLVMSSVTDNNTLISNGYSFFPEKFSLYAYQYIFKTGNAVLQAYGISVILTVIGTVLSLTITTLLAYALSRPGLPGRQFLSFYVFFTMLFNGGLVPTYMNYTNVFGLKNTFWALVIPGLVTNGFYILLMKSYFVSSIPGEITEAAVIDGASEFQTFYRVALPLAKPIVATIGLFSGIGYWNDWQNALYYIDDKSLYTVQAVLNAINESVAMLASLGGTAGASAADLPSTTIRMAVAVVGIFPVLVAYPFFQKYFAAGLMAGSVKG